jgi:hypothetical protein
MNHWCWWRKKNGYWNTKVRAHKQNMWSVCNEKTTQKVIPKKEFKSILTSWPGVFSCVWPYVAYFNRIK